MPSNIFLAFLNFLPKTAIFWPKNAKIIKNVKEKLHEKSDHFSKNPQEGKEYVSWDHFEPEKKPHTGFSRT